MTDRRTNSARRTFIQHLAWEIEAGHRTTDEARRQLEAMGIPLEAQCRLLKDAAERHDRSRTANLSEAYREYWTKFDQNRGVA